MFIQIKEHVFKTDQVKAILVNPCYNNKKLSIYFNTDEDSEHFISLELNQEQYEQYKTSISDYVPSINAQIKMLEGCLDRSARQMDKHIQDKKDLKQEVEAMTELIGEHENTIDKQKEVSGYQDTQYIMLNKKIEELEQQNANLKYENKKYKLGKLMLLK